MAQSTWMTIIQFYLSANSVYLVIYTLCASPGGCFVHPLGEDTLLVHPIEVYPYNCLDLGLKCSGHSYMYQIVPLLLALFVYMYELWLVLYLIILRVPPLMMSWEYPSDIIRGGNSLSYSNKLWYWQQYPFYLFDLIHILKLFSTFSYMY